MRTEPLLPACRTVVPTGGPPVRWVSPRSARDRGHLRSWCDAVGPIVIHDAGTETGGATRALAIVSWNMAVGDGDLKEVLAEARGGQQDIDVVLLIQEAYRAGTVPDECPAGSGMTKALGLPRRPHSQDIVQLAAKLRLHAVYAPSMRNGVDCRAEPREDRGNAILSTRPLSKIAVIELPFWQERRVAIAAVVRVGDHDLGLISTHFDTVLGHWNQGRGLSKTIELLGWKERFVIAGDFNSLVGTSDIGILELRSHFTELNCGRGRTHKSGTRLDHMFIGKSDQPFTCRTGEDPQGSDHHPLFAVLRED
jgi:endonuclease/exonuclease/phosphatase family metal-dependent hydrolase